MRILRLLAVIGPLVSQAASGQTTPDFELTAPLDHIRVPVIVTDKQGKPVSGLDAKDFKVSDNGKPASIAAFVALSATALPAAHFTVFYFDDRRLPADQIASAQKEVAAALPAALDSNGSAAIVTGTGSVNSGVSRDLSQLRQALASVRATPFAAQGTAAHNFDIVGTYSSLGEVASQMSKVPGRRLLVLVSPGFFGDIPEVRSAATASIESIVRSGVVLNAFNTQPSSSPSRSDDSAALEDLSIATGGFYFPGPSAPHLTQYPEQLYLLDLPVSGIRPDGASHQIKVTVAQPGARIRARKSFVAPKSAR